MLEFSPENELNYVHEYGDGINENITFEYQFTEMEWYNISISKIFRKNYSSLC